MRIYVVIKDIDDYPECGGGEYPDAVFFNYTNAENYAAKKKVEANARKRFNVFYKVEAWETADEMENEE